MSTPFEINGVSLDGVNLPELAHKGATFTMQDLDSSETGRNQMGQMMRDRITTKIKWQLTFPAMSPAMMSKLLSAISASSFSFTFPDPRKSSGTTTTTCYAGDKSVPVYSTEGTIPMWENISFSVIEM